MKLRLFTQSASLLIAILASLHAPQANAELAADTGCALYFSEVPSVSKKLPDLTESKRYVEGRQKTRKEAKL